MVNNIKVSVRKPRKLVRGKEFIPIESISVQGLFGKYNYDNIPLYNVMHEYPNVSFLYGENGIGKSIILRLVYSLLSPQMNDGHRTQLSKEKFKSIRVKFIDGQAVSVHRVSGFLGSYEYIFDGPRAEGRIKVQQVSNKVPSSADVHKIAMLLENVSPTMVFVNDNRTIRSTHSPWDVRGYLNNVLSHGNRYITAYEEEGVVYTEDPTIDGLASVGLERLLKQTYRLLVENALESSVRANEGAGHVYLQVIKTMSRPKTERKTDNLSEMNGLHQRFYNIMHKLEQYSKYGIFQGERISEIFSLINSSNNHAQSQMAEVIEPYIASVESRIDSNKALMQQMLAFDEGVNRFLKRKRMILSINEEITFKDDGGDIISPSDLSSGERHLLYICCTALLSRQRPSIIFVDEPELSLNYKWQRQLIEALISIAGGRAQFVMATHSFEIISRYRDGAVELGGS